MKFLTILALAFFLFLSPLFASNACWSYGNNMFYTHFWKNDTYPGWGSTVYQYYDDLPKVYDGAYKGSLLCGEINVNLPGTWTPNGTTCFIKIAGVINQGNAGTIDYTNFNECPIDDYVPLFLLLVSAYVLFRTKPFLQKHNV